MGATLEENCLRFGSPLPKPNLPHRAQQLIHIRSLIQWIHLRPRQYSVLVDDERRPLADSRDRRTLPQNAVFLRYPPMRIKVRAQRKMHRANVFLLPRNMAENRICAYVQNLGIERGELLPGGVERRQLRRSSGCPVQRMKRQDDVLLASEIVELHSKFPLSFHRRQLKIRRRVSNPQCHRLLLTS